MVAQHLAGVGMLGGGDLLGGADGHDAAAGLAPLGPEVDDPVGPLDDLHVVLDDQHGIARRHEAVQHVQEQLDVGEVQAGGGLVQQVERPSGAFLDQLAGQLDALGLAAGEGGRGLAELHVIEAHVVQRLQLVRDRRDVLEVPQRLLNVHLQHFGDRLALVADLQGLAAEAMSLADRAGDPDVGQEVHLQLVRAVPLAGLAPPAGDVEAEAAGLVAAGFRFGKPGEELADLVEDLDVGGGVGTRRAADGRLVDGDQAVQVGDALEAVEVAGIAQSGVEIAAQSLDEDVVDQRTLARAGNPRHADEYAQGDFHVDALEIVVAGTADDEAFVAGRAAALGNGDPPRAGQVLAGDALGLGDDRGERAAGHDAAAANAGTGTEIDDVVGRPHGVFVVLDHDNGVSQVAELGQRVQQLVVIAGVQADRGFVEDVEHAHQAAADLPGQPDALHLAAGKGGGGAVERQVLQAHIFEELQAAANFLEGLDCDQPPVGVQFQGAEELLGVGNRQGAKLGQRPLRAAAEGWRGARERDGGGLGIEPLTMAALAAQDAHVLLQLAALHAAPRGAILGEQLGNDALELAAPLVAGRAAPPGEGDVLVAGAPEQRVLHFLVEFFPGRLQHAAPLEAVFPFQEFGHAAEDVPPPPPHLAPRAQQLHAALLKGSPGRGNQPLRIEGVDLSQAAALRTHALRAVEAEQLRAGRLEAQMAVRAGVMGREREGGRGDGPSRFALTPGTACGPSPGGRGEVDVLPFRLPPSALRLFFSAFRLAFGHDQEVSVAQAEGQLHGFRQSSADLRSGHQAIDDHVDVVAHLPVQSQVVAEMNDLAIDPGTDEALLQQVLEEVAVLAFLPPNQGREDQQAASGRQGGDLGDDLLPALGGDRPTALGAMALAHSGIEHPEVVVDLGHGADGRAGVLAAGFLGDRDRRAQADNPIERRAWASGPGTAGRSSTSSRRSAAVPPHRGCRRPANSFPSRSPR